jgi:hypothetical protein
MLAASVGAQETLIVPVVAPAPAFSYPLGSVKAVPDGVLCSVQATAPRASAAKAQQMKFVVDYQGQQTGPANFRYYLVSTGRSKSLAQVQAMFADGFARAALAPPGTELCKLGDIAFGGEVRLVARGNGETAMIYNPSLSTGNPVFSPAETAAFAQILR